MSKKHSCPLPDNADDGTYFRCAHCKQWWVWKDACRVGADFITGWAKITKAPILL